MFPNFVYAPEFSKYFYCRNVWQRSRWSYELFHVYKGSDSQFIQPRRSWQTCSKTNSLGISFGDRRPGNPEAKNQPNSTYTSFFQYREVAQAKKSPTRVKRTSCSRLLTILNNVRQCCSLLITGFLQYCSANNKLQQLDEFWLCRTYTGPTTQRCYPNSGTM